MSQEAILSFLFLGLLSRLRKKMRREGIRFSIISTSSSRMAAV